MKSALSVGVAFIILLPLFASFSTAIPIEKNIYTSYNKITNSDNGTVTIRIQEGFNERGFLSRIGYTLDFDNTLGTKIVNFTFNITYHYLLHHDAYEWGSTKNTSPMAGLKHSVLPIPLPTLPYIITIDIISNTSTNLSLSRTGIMLLNCHVFFIRGNESVTGPS